MSSQISDNGNIFSSMVVVALMRSQRKVGQMVDALNQLDSRICELENQVACSRAVESMLRKRLLRMERKQYPERTSRSNSVPSGHNNDRRTRKKSIQ